MNQVRRRTPVVVDPPTLPKGPATHAKSRTKGAAIEAAWPAPSSRGHGPFLDRWRQGARTRVRGPAGALLEAVPADGYVPDVFTTEEYSGYPTDRPVTELRKSGKSSGTEVLAFGDALVAYRIACISPAMPTIGALRDDPLSALIGATRAEVLRALITGRGTTQLARDRRISPATASARVSALREAGLAATRRTGRAVRHTLTPLGLRLLGMSGGRHAG